jgi:ABC-type sugar transport system ATPase subunit
VASIRLRAIAKMFSTGHAALRGIDVSVADGEFLVLVGPSGCGKSTLLRLIAGLETPDSGRIEIGGRDVTGLPPQARDVAMVFQSYALYPHMTVRENLAYGLKVRGADAETIAERVRQAAGSLGLEALLDRRPAQLSGGQRQRVALGRAMVRTPQVFLLDEPLSNLDPGLRAQARGELRSMHQATGVTIVHVTHDQEEAMTLGDRIAVMRDGGIEQIGSPAEVYSRPANTFVARFIGAPAMNLVPPSLLSIDLAEGAVAGIRPHDVGFSERGPSAVVELVEPRGHDAVVHLRLEEPGGTSIVAVTNASVPAAGDRVHVALPRDRVHLFDGDGRRR